MFAEILAEANTAPKPSAPKNEDLRAIQLFDRLRSRCLRFVLRRPWLRQIFSKTPTRILFLYLLSVLIYLPLSLFFPLWVLLISTILFGVPHLFSSLRYVTGGLKSSGSSRFTPTSTQLFASVWFLSVASRLYADRMRFGADLAFNWIELGWLVVSVLGLLAIHERKFFGVIRNILFMSTLIYLSWNHPRFAVGAFILGHNLVAFYYFYLAAKTKSEVRVAFSSTLLFIAINLLIFIGLFDGIYFHLTPTLQIARAQLHYEDIGRSLSGGSNQGLVWYHFLVAYAFGQSQHYFIWLKAIPEFKHPHRVPPSFRLSLQLLVRDFGPKFALATVVISFLSFGIWAFLSLPEARSLYFSVAAFHGYIEISAIGLIKKCSWI